MYIPVASPSTVELVANISSSVPSDSIITSNSSIPKSSGPTPSIGDNLPNNTKYFPL